MNLTDTVATASINRIEWNGEPVVTSVMLAEFYGCTTNQIKQNFSNNRDRFKAGKHYYKLTGDELAVLQVENFDLQISDKTRSLYLWTKKGAARHCKMLGTDTAWDVFELLEDAYFNNSVKKEVVHISDFQRGKQLSKVIPFIKDEYTKQKVIAKSVNLILGYHFIKEPDPPAPNWNPESINLFYQPRVTGKKR